MDLARSRSTIASDKQSDLDDPLSARLGKCRAQIMPISSLSSRSINKPPTMRCFRDYFRRISGNASPLPWKVLYPRAPVSFRRHRLQEQMSSNWLHWCFYLRGETKLPGDTDRLSLF